MDASMCELHRGKPRDRVRPHRVERDAEDDSDLPLLPVVETAVASSPLAEESAPAVVPRIANLVDDLARLGHQPPSGVRSPRSPSGRNTRIRIRIANTIDCVQSLPGACHDSPSLNCWISPMMIAPRTAPGRLPMPPRTAAVNAIRPRVKPWSN